MTPLAKQLLPFLRWRSRVTGVTLRADAAAGLIGALVVLPQGVAYATLAGLPPQYGLYCAMVPAIVAALWGSSWHQISGPTNALALVVFATVAPLATPASAQYIELVLTLALLVGIMQLALGLARLGLLVNFISQTVIVGFTAGAGLLIIGGQLGNFFGVPVQATSSFVGGLHQFALKVPAIDPWVAAVGLVTLAVTIVSARLAPRFPSMIVGMVAGSAVAWLLARAGVATVPNVGALPAQLPPLSAPSFDPAVWRQLTPAALALTVLGLTQSISIARAIGARSGQRIDGNQEFIGQGLSNLAGAFTSSMPSSGSLNRCGVNFEAGAKTPLAAVFSALMLAMLVLFVAPLAAHLPIAVMAALLVIVAWGLVDIAEMRRIRRVGRGEVLVLTVTFLATLSLQLEFAVLVGVLASLFVYLARTTRPKLTPVAPDPASPQRRFVAVAAGDGARVAECPQLALLRVDGSLFFGAVEHVRDEIAAARSRDPARRHLLLLGDGVNFVDVAGGELLVQEAKAARDAGAALYLANLKPPVREVLERGGFVDAFGRDRVFETKDEAIRAIYARLDASVCRDCRARIFTECGGPAGAAG